MLQRVSSLGVASPEQSMMDHVFDGLDNPTPVEGDKMEVLYLDVGNQCVSRDEDMGTP